MNKFELVCAYPLLPLFALMTGKRPYLSELKRFHHNWTIYWLAS